MKDTNVKKTIIILLVLFFLLLAVGFIGFYFNILMLVIGGFVGAGSALFILIVGKGEYPNFSSGTHVNRTQNGGSAGTWDDGYMEGSEGFDPESRDPMYMDGWESGEATRGDDFHNPFGWDD